MPIDIGFYSSKYPPKTKFSRSEIITPPLIIEQAKKVLRGRFGLDPCTSEDINYWEIKAKKYLTKEDDALLIDWSSLITEPVTCFVHPPSGYQDKKSTAHQFWIKLLEFRQSGLMKDAIFFTSYVEHVCSFQSPDHESPLDFPVCFSKAREEFWDIEETHRATHNYCVVYVPGIEDHTLSFVNRFTQFGRCVQPKTPSGIKPRRQKFHRGSSEWGLKAKELNLKPSWEKRRKCVE